jgi:protein O-GlcNAc transferase
MNADGLIRELFAKALDRLDRGDWPAAETLLIEILRAKPTSIPTLNNLAIAQYEQNKIDEAAITSQKVVAIDPKNIDALSVLSTCQQKRGMYRESLMTCEQIVSIDPSLPDPYVNCAYILEALQQFDEALAKLDQAISLQPHLFVAFSNRGNVLRNLRRYDEALEAYSKALELQPRLADAWLGRGNVLTELKRHDEALVAYQKALELRPDLSQAWLGRGNVLAALKHYEEALAAYHKALELRPDLAQAWLGRGNVLLELRQYDQAVAAFERALTLKPDLADAWLGRGNVLGQIGQFQDALAAYDKAQTLKPDLAEAWLGRGYVCGELGQFGVSFAAYDKAFRFKPDAKYVESGRLYVKMMICDWTDLRAEVSRLLLATRNGTPALLFPILSIPSPPADQLACARRLVADQYPPSHPALWSHETYAHERIRVAYLSADLRDHPVAHLVAGLFEQHDRSRFEVTAISFGPEQDSHLRRRIKSSCEHFVEARSHSDRQIAELVRKREIEIAVDLTGFTLHNRTNIFAKRPAPIAINYLGYPGTMGAEYYDYILADRMVIPPDQQEFYSEKVVYLPDSYQVNDAKRPRPGVAPARAQVGLPEQGLIFCSFNNNYKINPEMFDVWMRLLRNVESSVLWLFEGSSDAAENLRREAAKRGVFAERLVFAPRASLELHLARHRLADLFLDTLPYNAHTTASDALWMGVPVLTCLGSTFAGRVAASLLAAVGLPELIATSLEQYESLALDLAHDPDRLAALKAKLLRNRETHPLFDTRRFARNIEAAYAMMWERSQRNEPPMSFAVGGGDPPSCLVNARNYEH